MRHTKNNAFTLVELIVAVSITMVMLFVVNQLFFHTTNAVAQGTALADILGDSRAIVTLLHDDADHMLGPHGIDGDMTGEASGGILMIINDVISIDGISQDANLNTLNGVELASPHGPDESGVGRVGNVIYRPVRSDQLVFIRKVDLDTLNFTPDSEASYTPREHKGLAPNARIWYGHLRRTNPNGSAPANGDLGNTNIAGGGSPLDSVATNWILGRQMLLLGENISTTPIADPANPTIHASGAWYNASVVGYNEPSFTGHALYHGLADYAYYSLHDGPGQAAPGSGPDQHPNGALVGGETPHTAANNPNRRLWASLSYADYRKGAILDYSFAQRRLHVNPYSAQHGQDFHAYQIAQMHPFLMEHVSDFIVEFAADITTGTDTAYGPDGIIDVMPAISGNDVNGVSYSLPAGALKWYTSIDFANQPGTAGYDSTLPPTWPIPANYQPYEEYDPDDVLAPHFDGGFVWRHDDEDAKFGNSDQSSLWPHLIRIRFRMHDRNGRVKSGDNLHGVWFEQIIHINRPAATP